jgi:hypothetical protein
MESANVYGFSRFKYSGNCWEGLKQMPSYGTYFLLKHRIWRPSKIGAGSKTCSIPLHESCTQTICFNTWCQGYKVSCSVNFRFPCKSFMKLCGKLLLELRTRLEKEKEREREREQSYTLYLGESASGLYGKRLSTISCSIYWAFSAFKLGLNCSP